MMIARRAGQRCERLRRRRDLRVAVLVRHPHQRVGIGDVQPVADQRHAEGREQVRDQHGLRFRDAVAVLVAQQRDAVGARHVGAGFRERLVHEGRADGIRRFVGRRWAIGFGDEHIAVRQDIQPARMDQAGGEGFDMHARCGRRCFAGFPSDDGGDLHRGQQRLVRRGERWRRTADGLGRDFRFLRARCGDDGRDARREDREGKSHTHGVVLRGKRPKRATRGVSATCPSRRVAVNDERAVNASVEGLNLQRQCNSTPTVAPRPGAGS